MIVYFNKLHKTPDDRSIEVYIKYFDYLSDVLQKFNEQYNKDIGKIYNQYGQELPLTYRVQKTGLEVYYIDD